MSNTKIGIDTESHSVEIEVKSYPTTTSELIDAFYAAMVAVGYSEVGVLEDMIEIAEDKLKYLKNEDRTIQD